MQKTWFILAAVMAALFFTAPAQADTVGVTKAGGDFIAGTGIPADNFTIDTNATTGESVALKARGRDTGQALSIIGTTYFLEKGAAASNASAPWWSFDFQFTPGTDAEGDTDYRLQILMDTDPTAGVSFAVVDMNIFSGSIDWSDTDGYFANPGGGAWSDDSTPYVISQSWRMNFGFIDPLFDMDRRGTYELELTAFDLNGDELAHTAITAQVGIVPLPVGAWMGFALLGALGLNRFRKRKSA